MQCPNCKAEDVYVPFYGPMECVNPSCSLYNERHRELIEKDKTKKQLEQLDRIAFYCPYVPLQISYVYSPYIPIKSIYKKIKENR